MRETTQRYRVMSRMRGLGENSPAVTLISDSSLQDWEEKTFLLLEPPMCVPSYGSPSKPVCLIEYPAQEAGVCKHLAAGVGIYIQMEKNGGD
jgi:hypothetical protein